MLVKVWQRMDNVLFNTFRWKMPNHASFLGAFGGFNLLKLWVATNNPKGTSLGNGSRRVIQAINS